MDIKLKRSKNILALVICFCISIITFNAENIDYYKEGFSNDFYKSAEMELTITAIGEMSVLTVLEENESKEIIEKKEFNKSILNDYKGADIYVVNNESKRVYSNKSINKLDDFKNKVKSYPYFMEINFKDNTTNLIMNGKKVNYAPKTYESPVNESDKDITTYIAIPSIDKIKEGKDTYVNDSMYLKYRQYIGATRETIVFIGSKIIAGVTMVISLVIYIMISKKKGNSKIINDEVSKNSRLWSLEVLFLTGILLAPITYANRFGILYAPLATLLLFEIYYIIMIFKESKDKKEILKKSIIFKQILKKEIPIENKIILIKGSILLVVFIATQLIVVCISYSLDIDYYRFQIMPHFALDWIGGHGKFLSALIGMIICNLIIGMFIIKRLNKVVDIQHGVSEIKRGNLDYKIEVIDNDMFKELATEINGLGDVINIAVEDRLKSERMKTDLITNVSHDLKTPLTAIINYISLMKKEDIQPEHVKDYVTVLDKRSQRLKILIDDLFEASKVSSNDIEINLEENDINQLLMQSIVEMEDYIENSKFEFIVNTPDEEVYILADGRKTFRVFENLISNILKYSLEGSRVYIDLTKKDNRACIVLKNISKYPLNFDADEITERFTRGDLSRNTEGSGLGLAIAKGIVDAQGGNMKIDILGDMFIVTIEFDLV